MVLVYHVLQNIFDETIYKYINIILRNLQILSAIFNLVEQVQIFSIE